MATRSMTIAIRGTAGAAEIPKDFRGSFQTDTYASYKSVVLEAAGWITPMGY